MGGFSFNWSWGSDVNSVERDSSGNFFYEIFNSVNRKNNIIPLAQKIDLAVLNPAFLKVLCLNCDLFSLGKINRYQDNKREEIDYLYSQRKRPNFFQSWTQYLWEYMFYRMVFGYAVMRSTGSILNETNQTYFLNPSRITFDGKKDFSKFVNSRARFNELQKKSLRYHHYDGTYENIPLSELEFIQDLTNAVNDNFLTGISRMDALWKVISNSDNALDAKAVNLNFSQKFLFSGQKSASDITSLPMTDAEKKSIEQSGAGKKKIHAAKVPVNIQRFVGDIANLKLDDSYLRDYYIIGSMYNIPRDVLEASLEGSTYENQEKATGKHVEYALKPAGQALTDVIEERFALQDIRMEWSHLAFNQVFEKDRSERQKMQLENLKLAQELGAPLPDLEKRITDILTM